MACGTKLVVEFCIFLMMDDAVVINNSLTIPKSELRFRFARSGGPGGQNVNKVETRVELLFDITNSPSLRDDQRQTIIAHMKSRVDTEGMLHVIAQASRSQWKNREDAVERFADLLRGALKPKKKRIATKISKAKKHKRLDEKKRRGEIKRMRGSRHE